MQIYTICRAVPSALYDVWEIFLIPAATEPEMSPVPINSSRNQSLFINLGHPPLFPPPCLYTTKDWDLHWRGRRTSQEEVMMFMMSLNFDSSQATKSLGAISCRRAFSGWGVGWGGVGMLLYEAVVKTLNLAQFHTHAKKASSCIILKSSGAAHRCFRTKK